VRKLRKTRIRRCRYRGEGDLLRVGLAPKETVTSCFTQRLISICWLLKKRCALARSSNMLACGPSCNAVLAGGGSEPPEALRNENKCTKYYTVQKTHKTSSVICSMSHVQLLLELGRAANTF